jgi:O-antigen biosynthesis alpha-1,2-mannosyltransferase
VRIGVMLRHYDQHGGGVKVYTQRLLRAMLDLKPAHEFVFLYRNPGLVGTYAAETGVEEVALPGRSVLAWDQIAVPAAVRRHGIDLLFNPKYSIPLRAPCPAVWVCHGLDWYVMPWASRRIDRLSHRFLVPRYASKAAAVIAVSEVTRKHVMHYLKLDPERVVTVYSGVDDVFRRAVPPHRLEQIRAKYSLPDRFLLYAGAIYPPKNFTRLIRAYAKVGPSRGIPLVVAGGENRFLSQAEIREPEVLGIADWVRWPGWVDQEDLAGFYALAEGLLLPSLFESCGLPVLEAMAAGCPVVTADRYGTKELAEGAAILVDPESVEAIAEGIRTVLDDTARRTQIVASGRERSRGFEWGRCAAETLQVLEDARSRATTRTRRRQLLDPASAHR